MTKKQLVKFFSTILKELKITYGDLKNETSIKEYTLRALQTNQLRLLQETQEKELITLLLKNYKKRLTDFEIETLNNITISRNIDKKFNDSFEE